MAPARIPELLAEEAAGSEAAFFNYELDPRLIAQHPALRREGSRLMVVEREGGRISDSRFEAIGRWLRPGDLLVANDSRVYPARLVGRKTSGGRVEALLLSLDKNPVPALIRSSKQLREGQEVDFGQGVRARVVAPLKGGRWRMDFSPLNAAVAVDRRGRVPLPPYIRREDDVTRMQDIERYQTVYARRSGSVAAPTAGLHFTDKLLSQLKAAGVGFSTLTLDVGPGTFTPIRSDPDSHTMEAEHCEVGTELARLCRRTRRRRGRVVAVGTTSVRALETASSGTGDVRPYSGPTDLFIRAPHRFKAVDALITNFHLPSSTLLCLVAAFSGPGLAHRAYEEAVRRRYRFYSFGDAMLIV